MVHACGRELWTAASYAIHAKACDGKPVQTRGRIERLAARAGRALVPVKPKRERTAGPGPQPAPQTPTRRSTPIPAPTPAAATGSIAAAATDKAMELTIAGLLAQRARIDTALAALEALRA